MSETGAATFLTPRLILADGDAAAVDYERNACN